jgi:threonine dehydratase
MSMPLVYEAEKRLAPVVRQTPVVRSVEHPHLSFKLESLQPTGSFKVRPAFNQILQLTDEQKKTGVVTSSSGNFAQAVAYAAKDSGVSATIAMMKSSNRRKVEGTRRWGAEVAFCEDRFEAREETVRKIVESEGRTMIHPYDNPTAVAGSGTIALEILKQSPEVENVVIPVSGGGLISGIAYGLKSLKPSVRVWGVQPEGSNATFLSYRDNKIQSIDKAETIADGLTVTVPGDLTFSIISHFVDGVETVSEDEILDATRRLCVQERFVAEPSAAVTLAACLAGKFPVHRTMLVISGGNISGEILKQVADGVS